MLALACALFATGPSGVNSPLSIHSVAASENVSLACMSSARGGSAGDSAQFGEKSLHPLADGV